MSYGNLGNNKIKKILLNPLFITGIFIKLLCSFYFSSSFLSDYFIPFVNYFVENHFANPYQYFLGLGLKQAFPYPASMLYILSLSKLTFNHLLPDIVIYRLPSLLADIGILIILARWLKTVPVHAILILYWLSPISLYITYIHGQLDVLPVATLILSIYLLFKENLISAFIMLGVALSIKTSMFLAYPFFIIYLLFHRTSGKIKILACACSIGIFLLLNAGYWNSSAFIEMIFNNEEQRKIFTLSYLINSSQFYLVPAIYILLLISAFWIKLQSRTIFIMFMGFAFGSISLLIKPMPGWYFWILPFFCYFYAAYTREDTVFFYLWEISYLIFFSLLSQTDYFLIENQKYFLINFVESLQNDYINSAILTNIFFTILQTLLFINCYIIYKKGISIYRNLPLASKPFLIGIGGNSGVGKSILSENIKKVFSSLNTTTVSGDDMHRWERNHKNWHEFTHLDPKANELHSEYFYLSQLKKGKPIQRKYYNHSTGNFEENVLVTPNKLTIFEGLHPFYIKGTRKLFDLKIFLNPDENLATHWKVLRDTQKRGYSQEKILAQIDSRKTDYLNYILPQIKHADIIIELIPVEKIKNSGAEIETQLKLTLENTIDIDPFLGIINTSKNLSVHHEYTHDDKQIIKINGSITKQEIEVFSSLLIPRLTEIGVTHSEWKQDIAGILQLFIAYVIMEKFTYAF